MTKQKGFAPLIIIVAITLIAGAGVVGYEIVFHQNNQPAKASPAPAVPLSPPMASPTPIPSPSFSLSPIITPVPKNSPTPTPKPTPIPTPIPTPTPIPKIRWNTSAVSLEADDFYIIADSKKFTNLNGANISSDPGTSTYQTLELTWTENDIPMRLYIYFSSDGNNWRVSEVRTYNGQKPGDWLFYDGFNGGPKGQKVSFGDITWSSKTPPSSAYGNYTGTVRFQNLRIQPFLNK